MTRNELIEKYNLKLVEHLESFFSGAQVYQDIVQEDEANLSTIHHVVFEMSFRIRQSQTPHDELWIDSLHLLVQCPGKLERH
ncbi:hypothetical protein P4G85_31695 [Bacillus cereus]|nr:hypothetical protein [Bacillus cereus]